MTRTLELSFLDNQKTFFLSDLVRVAQWATTTFGGRMITMHPGEYLVEVYLEPLGMTQSELAKRLQVDKSSVSRVIAGKAELSAAMAVRLSQVFDLSAEAWMEMQTAHSLALARKNLDMVAFDRVELTLAS